MLLAGSALWTSQTRMENGPGKGAGGEPLPTSHPELPAKPPVLCSGHSPHSCCWEMPPSEGNLSLGPAQTSTCAPDLAGRLAYTHTQNEHGNFSQGQMEMAFGLPTIWLDYLHHCLRPLLRRARRVWTVLGVPG